jgi:hypothetical protein
MTGSGRGLPALAALIAIALLALASGCGSDDSRSNELRPPTPIDVAVKIDDGGVDVEPARFGAGPITIVASNQSGASLTLTIDGPRVRQSVGPINPQDTATLKVNVQPGQYTLSADGSSAIKPAKVNVGPKRPSAQNRLLQP